MKLRIVVLAAGIVVCLLAGDAVGRGGFKGSSRGRPSAGGHRTGSMPNMSRPTPRPTPQARPQISRPTGGRPSNSRPTVSRPQVSRPQVNQPVSGLRPSTRPQIQRPSGGMPNRPSTLPANLRPGGERPNVQLPGGISRPDSRPSFPNLGDGNRPDFGNRPGGRPSPGDVGDFLGLDRPVTLPAGIPRPGGGDRPGRGDLNFGNNVNINRRPTWATNVNVNNIRNINTRWQGQINGLQNWATRYPNRIAHWNRWGNDVRRNWRYHHYYNNWFGPDWWRGHYHPVGGWHYHYAFGRYPYRYWWTFPTYAACTRWFTWAAPAAVWSQPIYYDYGPGGNVVYENNNVYVNGEEVGTAEEYAQDVAILATAPPPENEEEAAAAEWLPLGTFAIATNEQDVDPSQVIQLAVDKEGIISGTLYNTQTDQAYTVQGRVDKETQRVAFRIGDSDDIVMETGLYDLTQEETPVLVHFGTEKTETYLFVRLEQPEGE